MNLVSTLLSSSLVTCAAFTTGLGQRSWTPYHSRWTVVEKFQDAQLASRMKNNRCRVNINQRQTNFFAGKSDEEKFFSFEKDIEQKLTLDDERSYDSFGPLRPIAESIDGISGDWALSYADVSPETPKTAAGRAFLATNACYAAAGLIVGINGDWFFGALTEIAGIVSFWYHYRQLDFGQDRTEVRLALLLDYFTAGAALITGGFYIIDMGFTVVPFDALVVGALAIITLSLSWVWEFGYPYLFWHSLWHILSAYTAFLVGQAHLG